nr:TerB N-terminal domain-containing protein [Oceanococcus sp. HetDA_MAG_MS8]
MELLIIVVIAAGLVVWSRSSGKSPTAKSPPKREQRETVRPTRDFEVEFTISDGRKPGKCPPDWAWTPLGEPVELPNKKVAPNGGVYISKDEVAGLPDGWCSNPNPELIFPQLKVGDANRKYDLGYWPSYREIPPGARTQYLDWLADGAKDPLIDIGLLFLYFYGLERRALIDPGLSEKAVSERPAIYREVQRLLELFGPISSSFRGYATALRNVLALTTPGADLPIPSIEALAMQDGDYQDCMLLAGLQAERSGLLTPDEVFAAGLDAGYFGIRTAGRRCPHEFAQLFRIRLAEKYPDGISVKQGKSYRTTLDYRFARGNGSTRIDLPQPIPNLARRSAIFSPIADLVDSVQDELSAFSRWRGKNPESDVTAEALSHLPPELARNQADNHGTVAKQLRETIRAGKAVNGLQRVPVSDLISFLPHLDKSKFTKSDAVTLARLVGSLGYGMEPDRRFGRFVPEVDGNVYLFPAGKNAPQAPSNEYEVAAVLIDLGVQVALADGVVASEERQMLSKLISGQTQLSHPERFRLAAHATWMLEHKPDTKTGLKAKLENLNDMQRQVVADYLVTMAAADGTVSGDEVATMNRLYRSLGLNAADAWDRLHGAPEAPVRTAAPDIDATNKDREIPKPPGAEPQEKSSENVLQIDADVLAKRLAETARVQSVLRDVFVDEDETPPEPVKTEGTIQGLDAAHSQLLVKIAEANSPTRDDLESWADELGLFADGALEVINERALAVADATVIEDDDPLYFDSDVYAALTAAA